MRFTWSKHTKKQLRDHLHHYFDKYVIKNEGCWDWKGKKDKDGYCRLGFKNFKFERAHRVSWFLEYDYMPKANEMVCHTCDNPSCCNPKHLFIGDSKSNYSDRAKKRRGHEGELNPKAKLKEKQVFQIKMMLKENIIATKIASVFNVGLWVIHSIKSGKSWKHVQIEKNF